MFKSRASWLGKLFHTSEQEILLQAGLDAYGFLRLLRLTLNIYICLAVITIPILLPLNFVHGKNSSQGVQGLDRLSISNVGTKSSSFYWAHLILGTTSITVCCIWISREFHHFTKIRHQYLWSRRIQSNSRPSAILLSNIPRRYLNSRWLSQLFQDFPGGVKSVLINRDCRALSKQISSRDNAVETLETALTRRIIDSTRKEGIQKDIDLARGPAHNNSVMERLIATIKEANDRIHALKSDQDSMGILDSAFVLFNNTRTAELASQSLILDTPRQMTMQFIGDSTNDIVWSSLGTSWLGFYIRSHAITVVIAALCIAWTVPVAFTGIISQVTYLTRLFPQLEPINRAPPILIATLQGVVPQATLTILTILLPILIRILVHRLGFVLGRDVELAIQRIYFWVTFLQVFFTVSVSSSLTTILGQVWDHPGSLPSLIATNIPKTSNYFFSYMLLQGFSLSGGRLLQIGGLLNRLLVGRLRDLTPRQQMRRTLTLQESQWGSVFPIFTNLACIGAFGTSEPKELSAAGTNQYRYHLLRDRSSDPGLRFNYFRAFRDRISLQYSLRPIPPFRNGRTPLPKRSSTDVCGDLRYGTVLPWSICASP